VAVVFLVAAAVAVVAVGCKSAPATTALQSEPPHESVSASPVVSPNAANEAVIDCGVGQNADELNQLKPVHFLLANPVASFRSCALTDSRHAPTNGGGPLELLTAAPDLLGRLTFVFEDGVCWDRILHVTQGPGETLPIPPPSFMSGTPLMPLGRFDLSVETVYTDANPCPAIGVSRSVRIQLAGWPYIPIETSVATPPGASSSGSPTALVDCAGSTRVSPGDAVLTPAVVAVNTDEANFGGVYVDSGGALVVQYVGTNSGRPAVERVLDPSVCVRWERVERSAADLKRIIAAIMARNLNGVAAAGIDTLANRVEVVVWPPDEVDQVALLLGSEYGTAVSVVASSAAPSF